jgi:hypothetical protein
MTITLNGTTGITGASWTTAGRPSSPVAGQMGFNTTTGEPEWYDAPNGDWVSFKNGRSYSVGALIVAGGGGGGGGNGGGGGGAGGYQAINATVNSPTSFSVVIGGGGTGGLSTEFCWRC